MSHKRTIDEISNEPENLALQSSSKKVKESESMANIDKRPDPTHNTGEMDLEDLIAPSTVIKTGMKPSDFENRTETVASHFAPEREEKAHQKLINPNQEADIHINKDKHKIDSLNNLSENDGKDENDDCSGETSNNENVRKVSRKKGRKSIEDTTVGPRRELRSSSGRPSTENNTNH